MHMQFNQSEMAESPKDWIRLFNEVEEVKAILLSRGITESVNANGILNRLERKKDHGRVDAVVEDIIADLNSDESDVVVVDDGDDSSEVELVYQKSEKTLPETDFMDIAGVLIEAHDSPRGIKRHVSCIPSSSSSNELKRALTSSENGNMNDTTSIIANPVVEGIVTVPTEDAALPEEIDLAKQRDQINYLKEIFPQVQPEYLKIIVENCIGDEIQLNAFITDALENKFILPSVQLGNPPSNEARGENLPSCSKSVNSPRKKDTNNKSPAQEGSSGIRIPLQSDSTTPSVFDAEGAVGSASGGVGSASGAVGSASGAVGSASGGVSNAVVRLEDEIPGVSDSVMVPLEGTSSGQNENEDDGREEKDDLEKSLLYSEQLEYLIGVLPDADPAFLEDKITEFEGNAEKMKLFVTEALECPGGQRIYRTRGETQKKQEYEAQIMKFTKNFSVEDFLEVFPDPVGHFENPSRVSDVKIRDHCLAYLKARYKCLYVNTISQAFRKENYNLSLTVKELDKGKHPKRKTKRPPSECKLPPSQCISFLQEVAYIENKKSLDEYFEGKRKRRQEKFEEAKAKNELLTCNCCFDDELLSEDMSSCTDGHLFCIQCVKKGAEVIIGDGKSSFPCMQGDCKAAFSLSTLQGILAPSIFGKLVMRLQAEEVNAAGIEGLETCPSCPYSTIPAPEDKVFKCLNPDCMRETCRSCKEPSHIPLKCEEVEKNDEIKARTYIENKMTEALIRTCWKCSRQFIKESGCNKMTCSCGALMCYICRQPVQDYKHFNPYKDQQSNLCPLYSDEVELHVQSVKKEAEKAKEEVLRQNPNVNLKYDPTLKLPEKPSSSKGPRQPIINPFVIEDAQNPLDLVLRNVHDFIRGRLNDHRHVARGNLYQQNGNNLNEVGDLPQFREHGYNILPEYDGVPPVVRIEPALHQVPRHNAQPPNYYRARPHYVPHVPYAVPINGNPMVRNQVMPVHARDQPVRHHVYPPPPARQGPRYNPRR